MVPLKEHLNPTDGLPRCPTLTLSESDATIDSVVRFKLPGDEIDSNLRRFPLSATVEDLRRLTQLARHSFKESIRMSTAFRGCSLEDNESASLRKVSTPLAHPGRADYEPDVEAFSSEHSSSNIDDAEHEVSGAVIPGIAELKFAIVSSSL
jgi:hypothetical protein